jgi:hypothetical protein
MSKSFSALLEEEIRDNLLDSESALVILDYIRPREYASLREEYKQFVETVDECYTFGSFLLDVVVADRKYEEQQLRLLGGVKYISEYPLLLRSSESISFD